MTNNELIEIKIEIVSGYRVPAVEYQLNLPTIHIRCNARHIFQSIILLLFCLYIRGKKFIVLPSVNALKGCLHQSRNRTKLLKIKKSSGIMELKKLKIIIKAQLDTIERLTIQL